MKKRQLGNGIPVKQIAEILNAEIQGSIDGFVHGICPIDTPEAGHLAFIHGKSVQNVIKALDGSTLGAVLVEKGLDVSVVDPNVTLIIVSNPLGALVTLVPLFFEDEDFESHLSPKADIHPSATIGKRPRIGAFVSIGAEVVLGDDVTIHPQAVIYPRARIGSRTTIHAGAVIREGVVVGSDVIIQNGAVIGADGFGYIPDPVVGVRHVPQVGIVELADRVEIGANACIDRGTLGKTSIGLATKIDNLVQMGHNVVVGSFSFVCGVTGIAGSCTIGNQVTIGGHCGIADHITICDRTRFAGLSGITRDITEPGDYGGFPAMPARIWRRQVAGMRWLPRIVKYLRNQGMSDE